MAATTALVTGASSGMGKATASRLLADGYTVYAAARRVDQMADLAAAGATILKLDVTSEADIQAAFARIGAETGGVDVLVNSAGFASYGAMEDTTLADARYQFEVNLFGLARVTQLALPHMRQQRKGSIVNISSMGGKIYTPLGSWYHATKHALEGWSDCLRLELAPFGIRVIIVEPGSIRTDFGEVALGPLLERSGASPYAEMGHRVAELLRRTYRGGNGSDPSVVADVIASALRARRPRTRYATGRYARLLITLRRLTTDRMFDRIAARMAS